MICESSEAISKIQNLNQEEIKNLLKKNIMKNWLTANLMNLTNFQRPCNNRRNCIEELNGYSSETQLKNS